MISKASYYSSPYIGIFAVCNEKLAVLPKNVPTNFEKQIKEQLNVDIIKTNIADTSLVKILSVANSKKIFVPYIANKNEINLLKEYFSEVIVLQSKYTAIGNLICMNDNGAVCSKILERELSEYIKVKAIEIANTDLIGSVMFCNNRGFLAHRNASDSEIETIKKTLKVDGDVGSINLGDPYISSGIIGNSTGIIVGENTSGPELNRIDDIFILNQK